MRLPTGCSACPLARLIACLRLRACSLRVPCALARFCARSLARSPARLPACPLARLLSSSLALGQRRQPTNMDKFPHNKSLLEFRAFYHAQGGMAPLLWRERSRTAGPGRGCGHRAAGKDLARESQTGWAALASRGAAPRPSAGRNYGTEPLRLRFRLQRRGVRPAPPSVTRAQHPQNGREVPAAGLGCCVSAQE